MCELGATKEPSMPRRPRRLSPDDGPLAAFALELRALRDSGGPSAPTPEHISDKENVHRTTIYAALAGKRVPSRDVLAAMVRHWGGNQTEWTVKRSTLENALATTRQLNDQQDRETAAAADAAAQPTITNGVASRSTSAEDVSVSDRDNITWAT
ncbi:hypothetical protein BJF78_36065 [Pseudonocardia sp. CNS-139]|nr:hypothetical protein BJF78_36065 [Pseudonocardia sp. CNS-139]